MMDREWEKMKKEQEITRASLRDKGVPHIEVNVFNDMQGQGGRESPLAHTAFSMESLINTLLAMFTNTGDEAFISLLAFTTSSLDNIHALTADMIADRLKQQHGDKGFEDILEQMRAFYDMLMDNEEPRTDIPDAFRNAFNDEEKNDG